MDGFGAVHAALLTATPHDMHLSWTERKQDPQKQRTGHEVLT